MGNITNTELLKIFKKTLSRPIAFHRIFATIGGGVTEGLFLSQLYYWSDKTKDSEGWLYKTSKEWEEETALTRREQEKARKKLKILGILQEKKQGVPCQTFYRLDKDCLIERILGVADVKTISVEDFIEIYGTELNGLSKTGLMRAKKINPESKYVDYKKILLKHGLKCHICGEAIDRGIGQDGESLCFDHVIPLDKGGEHSFENILPAHCKCNEFKKDKFLETIDLTSLSTVDKQGCLPKTDQFVYGRQTGMSTVDKREHIYRSRARPETTPEITPEILSPNPSKTTRKLEEGRGVKESNSEMPLKPIETHPDEPKGYSSTQETMKDITGSFAVKSESTDHSKKEKTNHEGMNSGNSLMGENSSMIEESFLQGRRCNRSKGTYYSRSGDAWMASNSNPLPVFVEWHYQNRLKKNPNTLKGDVAAEIRNNAEHAQVLWEQYCEEQMRREDSRIVFEQRVSQVVEVEELVEEKPKDTRTDKQKAQGWISLIANRWEQLKDIGPKGWANRSGNIKDIKRFIANIQRSIPNADMDKLFEGQQFTYQDLLTIPER